MRLLPFSLVDVFASTPLSGNGLSVFVLTETLPDSLLQRITQEMRQFETIFLFPTDVNTVFGARIFTMEEELPFAGHPIVGATALMHSVLRPLDVSADLEFDLSGRRVRASSHRVGTDYFATMAQGFADFSVPLSRDSSATFLAALNLSSDDLMPDLPCQVVSTGLPYLIVPINGNLARARIVHPGFAALLETVGARFAYILDVNEREGRTWDNDGRVEDIATGSAAGPAAAYLVRHGRAGAGESIILTQGRFLNRPSELHALVEGTSELSVAIRGQVCFVGSGELRLPAD